MTESAARAGDSQSRLEFAPVCQAGTVPARGEAYRIEPGDRMLIPCDGGPSWSRLEDFPPRLEIEERGGMYVLVDDGAPQEWRYQFVAHPLG